MATKNAEKSNEDLKEKSRTIIKNFKRSSDPDSLHTSKTETRRGHPIDKGYAWVVLLGKYICMCRYTLFYFVCICQISSLDICQSSIIHEYPTNFSQACCVAVFLITGTFKSFGVLYVELITVFQSNATMTSVVQGLLIFMCSIGCK